jgi:hypothetical protein
VGVASELLERSLGKPASGSLRQGLVVGTLLPLQKQPKHLAGYCWVGRALSHHDAAG